MRLRRVWLEWDIGYTEQNTTNFRLLRAGPYLFRFCSIKLFSTNYIQIFKIFYFQFQLRLSNINSVLISIMTKIKSSLFRALHLQRALVLTEYNEQPVTRKTRWPFGTRCNRFLLCILFTRAEVVKTKSGATARRRGTELHLFTLCVHDNTIRRRYEYTHRTTRRIREQCVARVTALVFTSVVQHVDRQGVFHYVT